MWILVAARRTDVRGKSFASRNTPYPTNQPAEYAAHAMAPSLPYETVTTALIQAHVFSNDP
jgi:hypothetical protein